MTNTAPNSVDAAIAAANSKASEQAKAPVTDLVPSGTAPGGIQSYAPAQAPSLMDLTQGSVSVDGYLKVKEHGLLIDNKPNLIESVIVEINTNEMAPFSCVRFGNPPQYLKTYDNVICAQGGTWSAALQKAQLADPQCRPYTGADVPMVLAEDAKDLKGAVVATAGLKLGHSTSVTNKPALGEFIKAIQEAGLMGQTVKAKIGFLPKTNKNGQTWGIVTFELLEEAASE